LVVVSVVCHSIRSKSNNRPLALRDASCMEEGGPESQTPDADVNQTGSRHQLPYIVRVLETVYRTRKILVGGTVARNETANQGRERMEVPIIEATIAPDRGPVQLEEDHPAAGRDDADHLPKGAAEVRNVATAEGHGGRPKGASAIGQMHCIS